MQYFCYSQLDSISISTL